MTTTINNEHKKLNVPNLRFPEFQGEWEEHLLGNISDVTKLAGFEFTKYVTYEDTGSIIAIRGLNCKNGSLDLRDVKYIDNSDFSKLLRSKLYVGDILYTYVGTVGEVAVVDKNDKYYLAPNVSRIRLSKDYNSDFIKQLLGSKKFYNKIVFPLIATSSQPALSMENLRRFKLRVPSIKEQKKIASLFNAIDERIATQNKIIDKLQSLIKGISNKLLNSKEGMLVRLGAILKERSEKTKKNNQYAVLSSTVNGLFSQRDYFSKDIASENNVGYKIIRLHDVVLSPQNLWMGNINYNDKFDIGIVSPSYNVFLISDDYDKRYVAAMLKTHRALYDYQLISEQGASVVRRNLNLESFGQLVFRIPPLDKQREIGKTISLLKSRLETECMLKATYQSQKQYLLRQMFI